MKYVFLVDKLIDITIDVLFVYGLFIVEDVLFKVNDVLLKIIS